MYSIYIADLSKDLNEVVSHSPKLANFELRNLMYADDVILLSHMKISLQRFVGTLDMYSSAHHLAINRNKTKIMTITKGNKPKLIWHLGGNPLELANDYKYLGGTYDHTGSFKQHNEHSTKKCIPLWWPSAS